MQANMEHHHFRMYSWFSERCFLKIPFVSNHCHIHSTRLNWTDFPSLVLVVLKKDLITGLVFNDEGKSLSKMKGSQVLNYTPTNFRHIFLFMKVFSCLKYIEIEQFCEFACIMVRRFREYSFQKSNIKRICLNTSEWKICSE